MIEHKITAGLSTIYQKEVGHSDTLPSKNSSSIIDYLISTPAILTMIIHATSEMLDPLLPSGYITVGKNIELSHERPTLIGENISLVITVTKVKGESVFLDISGHDDTGIICRGSYERSIVDMNHLIDIAHRRSKHN
ncbi:MAG: hotdog domain-containing protein [Bacillota bacterium]